MHTVDYDRTRVITENGEQAVKHGQHPIRIDVVWKQPVSAHICACQPFPQLWKRMDQ